MSLFESYLELLLGPGSSVSLSRSENGHPIVRVSLNGVPLRGAMELEPGMIVFDEDFDDDSQAAFPESFWNHAGRVPRIKDFLERFPASVGSGDAHAVVSLEMPKSRPLWSEEGLCATVVLSTVVDGAPSKVAESELVVVTREAVDATSWEERLAAFDTRRAQWVERFPDLAEIRLEEARLEIPAPRVVVEDDGWDAVAERLGLDAGALAARVAPIVEVAFERLPAVRARYEELYGLKLPSGIATIAALVAALGELPENPEGHYCEPEPGIHRGDAWLRRALGMLTGGLTEWFAAGGLARKTRDASTMYENVPRGGEGPLDPRLDCRFRRDAPQFVTFLEGDSDGQHWGFWYDSPDHLPVVAMNYARDSAETWLEKEGHAVGPWLRARIADGVEEARQAVIDTPDDDYARWHWRALRVVGAHLDVIERLAAARVQDDEPVCPWPRTERPPLGSPPLALPPGAGSVPTDMPTWTESDGEPSLEQRRAWIEAARHELAAGRPAYAHALGLYLHWLDDDTLRAEAGALLLHAYEALGFRPFAAILKLHLLHRDMPVVAAFEDDPAPRWV